MCIFRNIFPKKTSKPKNTTHPPTHTHTHTHKHNLSWNGFSYAYLFHFLILFIRSVPEGNTFFLGLGWKYISIVYFLFCFVFLYDRFDAMWGCKKGQNISHNASILSSFQSHNASVIFCSLEQTFWAHPKCPNLSLTPEWNDSKSRITSINVWFHLKNWSNLIY